MDLPTRFAMVQMGQLIKVHQMKVGVPYTIVGAEAVTTRLGSTVAVHLRDPHDPQKTYFLYLPKRYAKAFTQRDIEDINSDRVWWSLTNNGPDPLTKMYLLAIQCVDEKGE
jgi:hypothetical protein